MVHRKSKPAGTFILPITLALILTVTALVSPTPSHALNAKKNEKSALADCEAKICALVLEKKPRDGWLRCSIGKTWEKHDIKKGAKSKDIGWKFGDAQCSVKVQMIRSVVIDALTQPKYKIRFHRHYVDCLVESGGGLEKVRVGLAPKLKFKNGRVKKVWINVKEVHGPPVLSSLIWTTAKLEDGLGIFHREMVDEINDFVHNKCAKRHGKK